MDKKDIRRFEFLSTDDVDNLETTPELSKEIDRLWEILETPTIHVDTQSAWQKVSPKIKESKTRKFNVVGWAAALIILTGLAWFANDFSRSPEVFTYEAASTQQEILLPDQSKVILAPGSSLIYFATKQERQVELHGSSFFTVKRDVDKPFKIKSKELLISVLGTAFEVTQSKSKNKVAVSSGRVMVHYENDSLVMQKGDGFIWDKNRQSMKSFKNMRGIQEGWHSNRLTFSNEKLENVLDLLAFRFDVDFKAKNQELVHCEISGNFSMDNIEETLDQLSLALSLNFIAKDNLIEISGPGC